MMNLYIFSSALIIMTFAGCNIAPYSYPDVEAKTHLRAINSTRVTVNKEFRYSPSFTSYVVPEGEYIPTRTDATGTYYESPRGILVQAATGSFLVDGGIYRRLDSRANYPFALYVKMPITGWQFVDLHSMWGLDLNEKIECLPSHNFQ